MFLTGILLNTQSYLFILNKALNKMKGQTKKKKTREMNHVTFSFGLFLGKEREGWFKAIARLGWEPLLLTSFGPFSLWLWLEPGACFLCSSSIMNYYLLQDLWITTLCYIHMEQLLTIRIRMMYLKNINLQGVEEGYYTSNSTIFLPIVV